MKQKTGDYESMNYRSLTLPIKNVVVFQLRRRIETSKHQLDHYKAMIDNGLGNIRSSS